LASGISDLATFELNGPTIASTAGSAINVCTFCAPCAGSCLPCTASSSTDASSLNAPPANPFLLACSIASSAPFSVGMPIDASPPLSGRSMPILIVPLLAPDDVPPEEVPDEEQAATAATSAAARTPRENEDVRIPEPLQ
jgi:hypothetical protein